MRGAVINSALMLSKLSLMIAQRQASRDFQDRILDQTDRWATQVNDVVPVSRAINGVTGAANEVLDVAKGAIVTYTYPALAKAVAMAIQEAQERSPDRGGPYSRAWIAVVDGQPWTGNIADIPSDALVYVVNYAPYARRLEQGWHRARSTQHRPGLFITEAVSQVVQSAFPGISVSREFVPLSSAPSASTNWQVPYVLRRGKFRGESILYPAISLLMRR